MIVRRIHAIKTMGYVDWLCIFLDTLIAAGTMFGLVPAWFPSERVASGAAIGAGGFAGFHALKRRRKGKAGNKEVRP